MPVEFTDLERAKAAEGLRMVVVTGVPSPWGEAAKGILHVKKIPWLAVALDSRDPAQVAWTGERSGPVAIYGDEPPRAGWDQILLLAERLEPTPSLVPADPRARAEMMGLSHELCGEGGLGWSRRLMSIHAGLRGEPGFAPRVAGYLAPKYGYRPEEAELHRARVVALLGMFAGILHRQRGAGSRFYIGDSLTAVDLYSAAFMALFRPLPPDQCPMSDALRTAFEHLDEATAAALDPILIDHRDYVYGTSLELPLTLR